MQGRLLPPLNHHIQAFPRDNWAEEFPRAQQVGFDFIEWIYDEFGRLDNPLTTEKGIAELQTLSQKSGVSVNSICADWFMDFPLLQGSLAEKDQKLEHLIWLVRQVELMGAEHLVLPFVDASRLGGHDDFAALSGVIDAVLTATHESKVELHLETDLSPKDFAALLEWLPQSRIKVNYDSGNSASLGYDVREEFAAYGNRIGSVHLKDRVRGGATVPLNQGNTNFPELRNCLRRVDYRGRYVLQVARGVEGQEMAWARANYQWARRFLAMISDVEGDIS